MATKPCDNCRTTPGWVWNEKTKRNDKECPACKGRGYVIVGNV